MLGSQLMESVPHTEVRPPAASHRGCVTLVTGCMFSGKTTFLLNHLSTQPGGSAMAIRHVSDDRYSREAIVAHDGRARAAHTINVAADLLQWAAVPGVRLLVVDEVHFLDAQLVDVVDRLTRNGLNIMMAGLDLDSWGKPFGSIDRLARTANHHIRRHAVCARCGGTANHTQRLTPIVSGRMVGGAESYEPRCTTCWTPPPPPVNSQPR